MKKLLICIAMMLLFANPVFSESKAGEVKGSNVVFLNESDIDEDKGVEAGGGSGLDTFINETGVTVDLITKYGTHNFNLTKAILDRLEEKIK